MTQSRSHTMRDMLLITRLSLPAERVSHIPRDALLARMDAGLAAGRRLTLVAAPPGFGKTTLLARWARGLDRPTAWLSVDESDDDPAQFLSYLIAALRTAAPQVGAGLDALLESPQSPPINSIVTALVNELAAGAPLLLVLDDYHRVGSAAVHSILQRLVEHAPPILHIALGTREDPPLPLAQLRARDDLTEIRQRDLRFSRDEADGFLRQSVAYPLDADAVEALEMRTEGWITGLQLAALALQETPQEAGAFIRAFTGGDRYITDYLVSEVLGRQPPEVRDFLRQTAILDRLSAPLCDAVTGRGDSQRLLERLERANVFLIPLDHQRRWYRYHALFADALRAALRLDEQAALEARAQAWFAAEGDLPTAIRHAAAYAALTGDHAPSARLIGEAAEDTLQRGALQTLRGWLEALPDATIRADGTLATYRAAVAAFTGDILNAGGFLDIAEAQLRQSEGSDETWGKLLALRAMLAVLIQHDYAAAATYAGQSLALLDATAVNWRLISVWALAEAQKRGGNLRLAIATLRQAESAGLMMNAQFFTLIVVVNYISCLYIHGERAVALATCERAIARLTSADGQISLLAGNLLSWAGRLHYEANDLQAAAHYLDLAVEQSEAVGIDLYILFAHAYRALLLFAQGEHDAAFAALATAQDLALKSRVTDANWFPAWEATLRLRLGDVAAAERWAANASITIDDAPSFMLYESQLALARLLIAQDAREADDYLNRIQTYAEHSGMRRGVMIVLVLRASLYLRRGQERAARILLGQAVALAAGEGYARVLLDEDAALIPLLLAVRETAPRFVDGLLNSARQHVRSGDDALSAREVEVLRLINDGLTNGEIAERLVIAIGTVKRHINHIYDKLAVTSRTQAVARGREMGLV
jgi:LuxR family transcriptional regulator, maltose regulon positive regulatory protein